VAYFETILPSIRLETEENRVTLKIANLLAGSEVGISGI
jgi:hypothetical protein